MNDKELRQLAELKAKKLNEEMDELPEGETLTIKFTKEESYKYKIRFAVIEVVE